MGFKGVYGQSSLNLDSLINVDLFNSLINEMLVGISKSWIDKGVVSCGSRENEEKLELCRVLKSPEKFLTEEQISTLESLPNLHQKAWYCSLLLPIHHPYSLVFIRREKEFWKKHLLEACEWTENSAFFPKTIEYIKSLPFEQIGRIVFFISEPHEETLIHYDGSTPEARNNNNTEMIYFRPFLRKKLFIWDEEKKEKHYVKGVSSFWNDLDWHGVDPSEGKALSLRVDGIFSESFRSQLQKIALNGSE